MNEDIFYVTIDARMLQDDYSKSKDTFIILHWTNNTNGSTMRQIIRITSKDQNLLDGALGSLQQQSIGVMSQIRIFMKFLVGQQLIIFFNILQKYHIDLRIKIVWMKPLPL